MTTVPMTPIQNRAVVQPGSLPLGVSVGDVVGGAVLGTGPTTPGSRNVVVVMAGCVLLVVVDPRGRVVPGRRDVGGTDVPVLPAVVGGVVARVTGGSVAGGGCVVCGTETCAAASGSGPPGVVATDHHTASPAASTSTTASRRVK